MRSTRVACAVAQYKYRNPWYWGPKKQRRPYGVPTNIFTRLNIDKKFRGLYYDHRHDLSDRAHLEESEAMRHPRELDFYQDHQYHTPWEVREMSHKHKRQLARAYAWMTPGFQIEPWVWYPGDEVEIITGPERGKRGRIRLVTAYKNEIIVEGVNVQREEIPASEDQPMRVMFNPMPINVRTVKHVDPSTQQICDLHVMNTRDEATKQERQIRVSTTSGTVFEIPERPKDTQLGDPLLDTPIQDAEEKTNVTDDVEVLAQQKLEALEQHFVGKLKAAYEYYQPMQEQIAADHEKFQWDVWIRAKEILRRKIKASEEELQALSGQGGPPIDIGGDEEEILLQQKSI